MRKAALLAVLVSFAVLLSSCDIRVKKPNTDEPTESPSQTGSAANASHTPVHTDTATLDEEPEESVAPEPSDQSVPEGFYRGIIREGAFFHDGRNEWIDFLYADVGKDQYGVLAAELGGVEDATGQEVETEIQLYPVDGSVDLIGRIGEKILFSGSFFEAETIYHQRNIVFAVEEVRTLPKTMSALFP